jgi:hypothetical protein
MSERKLRKALEEIVAVASGERQVAVDDTEGMEWIDKRARKALAEASQRSETGTRGPSEVMKTARSWLEEHKKNGWSGCDLYSLIRLIKPRELSCSCEILNHDRATTKIEECMVHGQAGSDTPAPRLILKCSQCNCETPKYINVQGLGCSECNPSRNVLAADQTPRTSSERCKANTTADPPQDCDFPFCGCFEMATKTIEALQECGWGKAAQTTLPSSEDKDDPISSDKQV